MQGCKESRSPFLSEWEVWKRFLQSFVNFSSVKNLFFKFLKVSSFKVKVCGREFFDSLKAWGKAFSLQGCKESRSPFLSEWEVWKRFLQVFWKYQVSRWKCVEESSSTHWKFEVCARNIGNKLKTSKKWNTQGSWNRTIVLTNKNNTKVICFQLMQSQNYGLQQLTKLEGFMCTQKSWKEIMKDNSKPLHYILSPNP